MGVTQQDVDDFNAQKHGFQDARAERIYWLEQDVASAEFVVTERTEELAEAKADLRGAKRKLREARSSHG